MTIQTIFIVGAGAWGTALANTAARAGRNVGLYSVRGTATKAMRETRENSVYLPGITLEESIQITDTLDSITDYDAIFMVTPTQAMREVLKTIPDSVSPSVPFVLCSKGIELTTGLLPTDILKQEKPNNTAVILSGPSFAAETAKGMITAVTIASSSQENAETISNSLKHSVFRPYVSTDSIGPQIAGAVKNVIAIACGIVHGANMGDNTKAALITRGLHEIRQLGLAMGAEKSTFMGLSGLGDLILTCSSMQSRNFSLGFQLGEGHALDDILANRSSVSEGLHTAKAVLTLAEKHQIDMPICQAVNNILDGQVTIQQAVSDLLSRPVGFED